MGDAYDAPEDFNPANLRHMLILLDNLKLARVKHFKHPSGLELTLDTVKRAEPPRVDEDITGGDGIG